MLGLVVWHWEQLVEEIEHSLQRLSHEEQLLPFMYDPPGQLA